MSVLGPYLADSKNNDASSLKHMIYHNADETKKTGFKRRMCVVDRGVFEDFRINLEMPAFIKRGHKQL